MMSSKKISMTKIETRLACNQQMTPLKRWRQASGWWYVLHVLKYAWVYDAENFVRTYPK